MSYTVLARRYRSETFDQVVGQEHVAKTLKRAIESGRIAHAFLFNGTRGVGKTSMARILAKSLNCEKSDGPTTTPCLKCGSCLGIARGDDIDVLEIDAASNTQVDKTREVILDNTQYRPARSRFKVYIIDEVHMLSRNSFNALLKTLEEPPSHVKFILATTEPEKIPATILSRCQRYDFRNIPTREIADHLRDIAKREKIKASEDALLMVAKAGAGSMRDALSLLDRLLSVGEKELTADMIEELLGLPKAQAVFDLTQSIGEGNVKEALQQADKLISAGLSMDSLLGSLAEHLRNLMILRTCGSKSAMVDVPGLSMESLEKQAQQFDPAALSQDITILEEVRRQLRTSQAGRALVDAALVRLALADQFTSIGELLSRVNGGAGTSATPAASQKKKFEPLKTATPVESALRDFAPREPAPESMETAPAASSAVISVDEDDDDDLPAVGKVWEGPSLAEMMKQELQSKVSKSPVAGEPARRAIAASNEEQIWLGLLSELEQAGANMHSVLSAATLVTLEDDRAVIRFSSDHETFAKMWQNNGKREVIGKAISKVAGRSLGVSFEVAESGAGTGATNGGATAVAAPPREKTRPPESKAHPVMRTAPAQLPQSAKPTPEQIAAVSADPLVGAIMDEFGAQIVKVTD